MGRKSRYKKYKAVDPFCVGQRKDLILRQENAFNKAPKKDEFEQRAPKGFHELMESMSKQQEVTKHSKPKKRKRKAGDLQIRESNQNDETNSKKKKYERYHWESDEQYLRRVDNMVSRIVNKEKMEILKSGGDQELPPKKLTKEKERKLKRIKKNAAKAKERKLEEQQEYTKAAKNDKMLDQLERDMMRDKIEFGDVAMEPPTLTKAPRKSQETSKPGTRELLLKGMISKSDSERHHSQHKKSTSVQKQSELSNKKVKRRKNMSASEKMRFDRTRTAAIEAYRKQRNQKRISLPKLDET